MHTAPVGALCADRNWRPRWRPRFQPPPPQFAERGKTPFVQRTCFTLADSGGNNETTISAEQNRQLTERIIEELFNRGNTAAADEFIHSEFVDYNPPPVPNFPTAGMESVLAAAAMFRGAFPDVHFTTDELIAEGDAVVQRHTMRGTRKGPLMGLPPTGRAVTMTGINILHFETERASSTATSWTAWASCSNSALPRARRLTALQMAKTLGIDVDEVGHGRIFSKQSGCSCGGSPKPTLTTWSS